MIMISEGLMKKEPYSFSIRVESCKQCPHVRWFSWGAQCGCECAEHPIISIIDIDKIAAKCPYRAN